MNDQQLERNLRSVGKECFIAFFKEFCNFQISNEDLAARIKRKRGYTDQSCRSRTSHARSIIKEGRAADALQLISLSTDPRVTARTRQRANVLIACLRESGKWSFKASVTSRQVVY